MTVSAIWRGDAPAVAQLDTITTGGTAAAGQVYGVTRNAKTVSYTAGGGDTNATITAALLGLLQASTIPEFQERTWAAGSTTTITSTAVNAGQPSTFTTSATVTGTLSITTTTASSGPNDASIAANWSTGALPVTGQNIVFDSSTVDCLYGLSALAAVQPANVYQNASYSGKIGLPSYNGSYYEDRPQYLQLAGCSGVVNVGYGSGPGSGRAKYDFGTTNTYTVNVEKTAAPADSQFGVAYALLLKGGLAGCAVNVNRGAVGIAALPGETARVDTLNVGYVSQVQGDAVVYCGTGATLATVTQAGGTLTTQSAITTLTQLAGTCYHLAGLITTANVEGTLSAQASGTFCTTCNVLPGGVLDLAQDMRARTTTNPVQLYKGATLNDPDGTLFAGGPTAFKTVQCTLADVTVNAGINHTYTPS